MSHRISFVLAIHIDQINQKLCSELLQLAGMGRIWSMGGEEGQSAGRTKRECTDAFHHSPQCYIEAHAAKMFLGTF